MKKIKLSLPLFCVTTLSGLAFPLTSCGTYQYGWNEGEDFKPSFEPIQAEKWYHTPDATQLYFSYAMKNPKIISEDYAYAFIRYSYAPKKQELIQTSGVTDLVGTVKARANNIKIEEQIFGGLKHYIFSGDFENEMVFNYHKNDSTIDAHVFTETIYEHWNFKNMEFGIEFRGFEWTMYNPGPYHSGVKTEWEDNVDLIESVREQKIEKNTGHIETDKTDLKEMHYHHNYKDDSAFSQLGYESAFFTKIKAYRTMSVQTNQPTGVATPIVRNSDDIPMGADYDTDIILDGLDKGTWVVAGIDMNRGKINVSPNDYTFEIVDGVGKLHINALTKIGGKPTINFDPTIHMTYTPNE